MSSTVDKDPTPRQLRRRARWCLVCGLALVFATGCEGKQSPSDPEPAPPTAATQTAATDPSPAAGGPTAAPDQPTRDAGTGDVPVMIEQFNRAASQCHAETFRAIKAEPDRAWTEEERDEMTRECLERAGYGRPS